MLYVFTPICSNLNFNPGHQVESKEAFCVFFSSLFSFFNSGTSRYVFLLCALFTYMFVNEHVSCEDVAGSWLAKVEINLAVRKDNCNNSPGTRLVVANAKGTCCDHSWHMHLLVQDSSFCEANSMLLNLQALRVIRPQNFPKAWLLATSQYVLCVLFGFFLGALQASTNVGILKHLLPVETLFSCMAFPVVNTFYSFLRILEYWTLF